MGFGAWGLGFRASGLRWLVEMQLSGRRDVEGFQGSVLNPQPQPPKLRVVGGG